MAANLCAPASVSLACGKTKTGKTAWLVNQVVEAFHNGASLDELLVFAASPDSCIALREQLRTADAALAATRIITPRAFALEVLSSDEAQQFTGRKPRLMARFEENFLMEDMKVSGLRPGRIDGLLHFFYRQWTELADLNEGWLIYKEEEEMHGLLKRNLSAYRSFLEPELANAAYRFLSENEEALAQARVAHVFVDDYQCLSRASQFIACLVAETSLAVAADAISCVEVFESYPYAAGIDELQELPQTTLIDLGERKVSLALERAISALEDLAETGTYTEAQAAADEAAGTTTDEALSLVAAENAADECRRVSAWVNNLVNQGAQPGEIAIVVPNKTWERNIGNALKAQNIVTVYGSEVGNVGSDVRYLDLSRAGQFITLLTLADDPTDEMALRAWCGFGDYLTLRSLFSELVPWANEGTETLASLLGTIHEGITNGTLAEAGLITYLSDAAKATDRLNLLGDALEALNGLRGAELASALAAQVAFEGDASIPRMVQGLLRDMDPNDDATALRKRVWNNMLFPSLSDGNAVKIVTPERCLGLNTRHVAVMGLVNGFTPKHSYFDRTKVSPERAEKMLAEAARRLLTALCLCKGTAALFWFEELRAIDAERLGLRSERFFIRNGVRYARTSRSLLIDRIEGVAIKEYVATL